MPKSQEQPISLIELSLEHGLTDEQIEEQLVTSVAVFGLMILEDEYDNSEDGMAFTLTDDIGEIEVVVRRVQTDDTHANPVSKKRVLH